MVVSRQRFFLRAAAVAATAPLASCSQPRDEYRRAVAETWYGSTGGRISDRHALQRELVRCATLAPSSHNTQCWNFKLERDRMIVRPDLARRCPAVDPDDHHLFVSLGCATENLVLAARARGWRSAARFNAAGANEVQVDFEPATPDSLPHYRAIALRQCSRAEYDGRPLQSTELQLLERAGTGNGVHALLLTGPKHIESVLQYVVAGNTAQMTDPAFMDELQSWIRFSDTEAVAKRDGLFSRASGSPSIPRWFADPLFKLLFTAKGENEKYSRFLRSSAGIAVFVSDANDKAHWVEAGRAYERFVLQATTMGVSTAMINQPVEVASVRPRFADSLGIGARRPDLVVRFGRGPLMPRSLRRPVAAVVS